MLISASNMNAGSPRVSSVERTVVSFGVTVMSRWKESSMTRWIGLAKSSMSRLSKPVHLVIDASFQRDITVTPNEKTIRSTLESRGDYSFMFEAEINLRKNNDTWEAQ